MKIYKLIVRGNNRSHDMPHSSPSIKEAEYYVSTLDNAWKKLRQVFESRLGFSREIEFDLTFDIKELDVNDEKGN